MVIVTLPRPIVKFDYHGVSSFPESFDKLFTHRSDRRISRPGRSVQNCLARWIDAHRSQNLIPFKRTINQTVQSGHSDQANSRAVFIDRARVDKIPQASLIDKE